MLKVLRVDRYSNLVYQKGLLSTELEEIFSNAPSLRLLPENVKANKK